MIKIKCLTERRIRICTCDPIADPGGIKTYGSGSGTLVFVIEFFDFSFSVCIAWVDSHTWVPTIKHKANTWDGGKTVYVVFNYMSRSLLLKGVGIGEATQPPLSPALFSHLIRGYFIERRRNRFILLLGVSLMVTTESDPALKIFP